MNYIVLRDSIVRCEEYPASDVKDFVFVHMSLHSKHVPLSINAERNSVFT